MVNLDFVGGTPLNPQGNEVFGGLPLEAEVISMMAANAAKKPKIPKPEIQDEEDEDRTVAYDMTHGGVHRRVYYNLTWQSQFYKITKIIKRKGEKAKAKITFLRGYWEIVGLDEILDDTRIDSRDIEIKIDSIHEQALEEYARRAEAKSPEDDVQF